MESIARHRRVIYSDMLGAGGPQNGCIVSIDAPVSAACSKIRCEAEDLRR
ncbi:MULTISPECIES: hypothetical protein [unclassified Mesorhizobium]|nr:MULTISPECIES: hypothetical protein [unclassified Mesorhizobium]